MRLQKTMLLAVAMTALALAAGGLLPFRPWQPAYEPRGQGELFLALGDSLAWGFRLDDPATQSYPALLAASLAAHEPLEALNLAVPGETTSSFVARQLPRAVGAIRQARGRGLLVSPITLDIGGNDLRSVERAGPDERAAAIVSARRHIAYSLDQLRAAAGPAADIAIMTYYNPYGGDPSVPGSDAYYVEQLNLAIREEAGRRGVAVADVYPAFADGRFYTHTFILFGDIHANPQGHELIAATFLEALGYTQP